MTWWFAPLLALGPFTLFLISTAVGALLSVAGALLAPKPGRGSSAVPGFDRLSNAREEGSTCPVLLCKEHLVSPLLISAGTLTRSDKQSYKLLYLVGPGELGDMSDWLARGRLRLNGEIVTKDNYPDLKVTFRYGTADQTVIPGFEQVRKPFDVGTKLVGGTGAGTVFEYEMKHSANEVHVLFTWASGFYRISDSKGIRGIWGTVKIQYRRADQPHDPVLNPWVDTEFQGEANPDWHDHITDEAGHKGAKGTWYTRGHSTSAVRRQIEYRFATRGRYVLRFSDALPDSDKHFREPTISTVFEVIEETRTYPGDALLAIEGVVTESMGSAVPTVELLAAGLKIANPWTSQTEVTQNPILHALEVIRNATWGLPTSSPSGAVLASILDDGAGGSWETAYAKCNAQIKVLNGPDEPRWRHNRVLDREQDWEEILRQILETCRAQLLEYDGQIHIVQDLLFGGAPRVFDARKVTSNRNNVLSEGEEDARPTFELVPPDPLKLYTHVEMHFRDADDDYRPATFVYPSVPSTGESRPYVIELDGVVHRTQAEREARYHYGLQVLAPNFVEFGCGPADLDLVPFEDVVALYDDYHGWAGKLFKVYAATLLANGAGGLLVREYDPDVYDDTKAQAAHTLSDWITTMDNNLERIRKNYTPRPRPSSFAPVPDGTPTAKATGISIRELK